MGFLEKVGTSEIYDLRCLGGNLKAMSDELMLLRNFLEQEFDSKSKAKKHKGRRTRNSTDSDSEEPGEGLVNLASQSSNPRRRSKRTKVQNQDLKQNCITNNIVPCSPEISGAGVRKSLREMRCKKEPSSEAEESSDDSDSEGEVDNDDFEMEIIDPTFEVDFVSRPEELCKIVEDEGKKSSSIRIKARSSLQEDLSNNEFQGSDCSEYGDGEGVDLADVIINGSGYQRVQDEKQERDYSNSKMHFFCPVCKVKLDCTGKEGITEHRESHSKEEYDSKFVCRQCMKVLKDLGSYVNHKKSCKIIEKAENVCSFCDKVCYDRNKRIVHERTHTGEKPFACSICKRTFNAKSSLTSHRWTTHRKILDRVS